MHCLENSKYWPFQTYYPMGIHTSTVSRKKAMVINCARSHAQCRASIGFSCTVSEIQNTSHSRCISQWKVIRAQFHEKTRRS
ncbi:hypothetical protein BHE74_00057220 [Ensete ventricosum]|nr:hypothetical protein BHE74_00057220 [Ensete ventricosum]